MVGETFVTRKITRAVAKISLGQQKELQLGNLGPVPQNFPKFLPKLKPKSTFENLKYARWIS